MDKLAKEIKKEHSISCSDRTSTVQNIRNGGIIG